MKELNLATQNTNDFTVTEEGEAFISQSAISRATGIPQQTLSDWVRKSVDYNTNELNQLDAKSMQKVVILGSSKYPSCLTFMGKLLEAGAKAYIYHEAGYAIKAIPPKPKLTPLQQAYETLKVTAEALEIESTKRANVEKMLETATRIQTAALNVESTLTIDKFCKIIGSKLDNVTIGRTTCYVILRSIGLVEKTSARPSQRGMMIYLDYKPNGEYGYSTRVHKDKCDQLIKLMIRHLSENNELNEVLGNPLGDI